MENIKIFDFKEAKFIRSLEPIPKHFHFFYDRTKGINTQSMGCFDHDTCPICNHISDERKSFLLRFKILILDIISAFKKFERRKQ